MLKILCNTSGAKARDLILTGHSAATGYDQADLITGPRSKRFRTDAQYAGTIGYTHDNISVTCDHLIIARADWLLTLNAGPAYGTDLRGYRYTGLDASGASAVFTSTILDDSTDLIGYRYQDYVKEWTPASGYGWAIDAYGNPATTTTHTFQCSKLYFASAFDFGVNPKHQGISWEYFSESKPTFARTLEGTFDYAVEARITVELPELEPSNLDSFAALPEIYRWPFFLYDSDADVIPWKLEHVILERFEQRIIADNVWGASLSFLRLKHYA